MFKCKYSSRCGGCLGSRQTIEDELKEKTNYIRKLFSNYDCDIPDCKGEYYPLKYRNKIHLAFGELKGKTIIGFFEEGSSKITDVDDCLLYEKWASTLISILREYVSRFKIRPYSKFGTGIIRYAHARCIGNKLQLTLVVTTENFPGRDWLYHKLSENFSEVSLYLNINRRTDHAVFDKTFKFVKGNKFLNFEMCGVKVSLSPASFLQINLKVADKMYKQALQLMDIKKDTTIVDLYSGIGITSVMFAKNAKQVISIEEVLSAVDNAKYMAKINDCSNIIHFCGKCEKEIGKLKVEGDSVVFVDPARAGLEKSVIEAILKFNPRKIVYMSCNPETCVRDIDILTKDKMYSVSDISAWNMFPYTKHIETLVVLERKY